MKPVNKMVGNEITVINRPPYKNFKRITGMLVNRERGILVIAVPPYNTEQRFAVNDWEIESVNWTAGKRGGRPRKIKKND